LKTLIKKFLLFSALFVIYIVDCNGQITWKWVKSYGDQGSQQANDMVTDSQGNIYIAGSFWTSATFGEKQFTANPDYGFGGFVAKFDSTGTLIWANQVNADNEDKYASAIVIDQDQNIYVTGGRLKDNDTAGYMFLNKYSNDGSQLWSQRFNDYYWDDNKHKTIGLFNNIICVAGSDSIYTIHASGGIISRKQQSVNAICDNGKEYFYAAKDNQIIILDTLLNIKKTLSVNPYEYKINGLTTKNNYIYLTGYVFTHGYQHMFVAKLDSLGQILWVKTEGGQEYSSAQGNAIVVDKQNKVCVTGFYRNVVQFDTITVGALGLFCEVFVARYNDISGKLEDFIHGGGDGDDIAYCLNIDSSNNLYIAGKIAEPLSISVNFGDIMVSSLNQEDMFIANAARSSFSAQIKGQITINNASQKSYIKIFKNNEDSTFTLTYRGQTNESGKYDFTVHKEGSYLVKSDNWGQVGTYYPQTFLWNLAEPLNITSDTTIDNINIDILQCSLLTGEDSISGKIYSYDSIPKRFIDILLVTLDDQLVSYTRSDTFGTYCFANVHKGQFKILVDSAGMYMDSYYIIDNLSKSAKASSVIENSLEINGRSFKDYNYFFGNDHKIYKATFTSVGQVENFTTSLIAYPNPASTFINVGKLPENKDFDFKIYNLMGNCVYESKLNSSFYSINISSLPDGVYIIKLGKYRTTKFVKMK
jgi:hypothetical protein